MAINSTTYLEVVNTWIPAIGEFVTSSEEVVVSGGPVVDEPKEDSMISMDLFKDFPKV